MKLLLTSLIITLMIPTAFATNSCSDQLLTIERLENEIHAIKIPDLTYSVSKENCEKVDPTLRAAEKIGPRLGQLQGMYEDYYQSCDRSMDVIYAIEEVKINIILMNTLKDLAHSLAIECKQIQ